MGLLDQVIGNVLGQVLGGGRGHERGDGPSGGGPAGGGLGGAMSPIVQALLMLLLSKGAGGLGDILGGGRGQPQDRPSPSPRDDGDLGGFGQDRGEARGQHGDPGAGGGDFGDLAGMLDGPGDRGGGTDAGAGPYAHLDHEADDGRGADGREGDDLGGLDGLIDRFQRGGFGDLMQSWIGQGQNRPVQPHQLADALGADTVDALQQRTGLDRSALLSQLAQALPEVIDRLTPQGRRPDGDTSRGG